MGDDLEQARQQAAAELAERRDRDADGKRAADEKQRLKDLEGAEEYARLRKAAADYLRRADPYSDGRASSWHAVGRANLQIGADGRVYRVTGRSRNRSALEIVPGGLTREVVDEVIEALGAALAEREHAAALWAAGITKMRAIGEEFAGIVSSRSFLQSVRGGSRPRRVLVATKGSGEKRSQRGWGMGRRGGAEGESWVAVLDDGRVGVEAWTKVYPGMGYIGAQVGGTSHHHEWEGLPWSEELEELLEKWLIDHAFPGLSSRP